MSGQQSFIHDIPENTVTTLAEITSDVLAATAAAQYASIAWARGRWLTGQAPTLPVVATLDGLQAVLEQGPCLDALRARHTITIFDMDNEQRWPVFAARAAALGVGSMLSLPLVTLQDGFGVLNLYATRPHAFTGDDETIAAVFATHAAIALRRAAERDSVQAVAGRDVVRRVSDVLTRRHPRTAAAVVNRFVRGSRDSILTLADPGRRPCRTARGSGRRDAVSISTVAHGLDVACDSTADAVVVRASGAVDMHTAPGFDSVLRAACIAAHPSGVLVIDLGGIRFFSAAGLTLLLTTKRSCHEQQVALKVVATQRSVLRLLAITELETLFDIAPTVQEALRPYRTWPSTIRHRATPHPDPEPAAGGNERSAS
jgi:anti-anti-sigma factor